MNMKRINKVLEMKTQYGWFLCLAVNLSAGLALPASGQPLYLNRQGGTVVIGSDGQPPNTTAALDVKSTTGGVLMPRMTTLQRTMISFPATGLLVFDTDTQSFWVRQTGYWYELRSGSETWRLNGSTITNVNNGNVGIGVDQTVYKLHVGGISRFDNYIYARGEITTPMGEFTNVGTGPGLTVNSSSTDYSLNTENRGAGPGFIATTRTGIFAALFNGRLRITGKDNLARSGGIEFRNDPEQNSLGFVGMNGDTEMGFYSYPLGDWLLRLHINTGTICSRSAITLCSDLRLKRDIRPVTGSLPTLLRLNGMHYAWQDNRLSGLQTGFIAQEVQQLFPELVHTDETGLLSVNYIGFIPHLVEAVKSLRADNRQTVGALTAENQRLRQQLEQLADRLSVLEAAGTNRRNRMP